MKKILLVVFGLTIGVQIFGACADNALRKRNVVGCKQCGPFSVSNTAEVAAPSVSLPTQSLVTKAITAIASAVYSGYDIVRENCTKVEYKPKCDAAHFNVTNPGPNAPTSNVILCRIPHGSLPLSCHKPQSHLPIGVPNYGGCGDRA